MTTFDPQYLGPEGDIYIKLPIACAWKPDASSAGIGMKQVDFIVETAESYLFIELKDINNPNAREEEKNIFIGRIHLDQIDKKYFYKLKKQNEKDVKKLNQELIKLLEKVLDHGTVSQELVKKFKDTLLYQWACEKCKENKKIYYITLLCAEKIVDDATISALETKMKNKLPLSLKKNSSAPRELIDDYFILTLYTWQKAFPQFPITRVSLANQNT